MLGYAAQGLPGDTGSPQVREFLRRAVPFDSSPLDDSETAFAADQLFALLDAEEK